jgi:hypothetical protein
MNKITYLAIASLSLQLIGCVPSQIVSPDYLASDSTKDIRITSDDGSVIVMRSGDYSVLRTSDSLTIIGKGQKIARLDWYAESSFNGSVSRNQIAVLEVSDSGIPPAIRYPLYFIGAISTIYLAVTVALALSLHGHGFGG